MKQMKNEKKVVSEAAKVVADELLASKNELNKLKDIVDKTNYRNKQLETRIVDLSNLLEYEQTKNNTFWKRLKNLF